MYCSFCGNSAAGSCLACEKRVCRGHGRRFLGVTLCANCRAQALPGCLLPLALLLTAAALAWRYAF
jgi:hypothetical protein